jgi:GTPase
MGLPIVILFTKIDMIPIDITAGLIVAIKKKLISAKRTLFHIKTIKDTETITKDGSNKLIPFILTSNKTGVGLDLLRAVLRTLPKKQYQFVNGFTIEKIYNVQGCGTVLSGMSGCVIKKGDTLFLGPHTKGEFIEVRVKTLHNDYRYFVDELTVGKRGCICINISKSNRQLLRPGMVLSHDKPKNVCRSFLANVKIFPHHHTTIKLGYQTFVNCGMIRETIKITSITDKDNRKIDVLRGGEMATVEMTFMKNLNYLEEGQTIIFREGFTRGFGVITKLL